MQTARGVTDEERNRHDGVKGSKERAKRPVCRRVNSPGNCHYVRSPQVRRIGLAANVFPGPFEFILYRGYMQEAAARDRRISEKPRSYWRLNNMFGRSHLPRYSRAWDTKSQVIRKIVSTKFLWKLGGRDWNVTIHSHKLPFLS